MINRLPLWLVLWAAALLWFALLWISGQPISISGLGLFDWIPSFILVLVGIFDRVAWRWPIVKRFTHVPDARGTWRGELISNWKQPDGQALPPITACLVIRQTYFAVWVRLLSEQSASITISAELARAPDGVTTLVAVYRNVPRMSRRATSPIHFGAFLVELQGDPVKRISGHYWTDRLTQGEMTFSERASRLASSFQEAASLPYKS